MLHGDGGCVAARALSIVYPVLNIGYCVLSRTRLLLPIQYSFVINNLFVELKFALFALVLEGFLKILKFRRSTWVPELQAPRFGIAIKLTRVDGQQFPLGAFFLLLSSERALRCFDEEAALLLK